MYATWVFKASCACFMGIMGDSVWPVVCSRTWWMVCWTFSSIGSNSSSQQQQQQQKKKQLLFGVHSQLYTIHNLRRVTQPIIFSSINQWGTRTRTKRVTPGQVIQPAPHMGHCPVRQMAEPCRDTRGCGHSLEANCFGPRLRRNLITWSKKPPRLVWRGRSTRLHNVHNACRHASLHYFAPYVL